MSEFFSYSFSVVLIHLSAYNHPFDTARNRSQDFVRYGTQDISQLTYFRILSENHHGIAHLAVYPGHVEHTHIHTDVAYGRRPVPVNAEACCSPAQMPVNSVSIAMGSGIELSLMGIKVTADTKYHTLMKAVPTKIKWVLNLGELRLNLGSEKVYCEPFIRDLTQRGQNKLAKMKDTERLIPVTLSDIEPDAILWKITIE